MTLFTDQYRPVACPRTNHRLLSPGKLIPYVENSEANQRVLQWHETLQLQESLSASPVSPDEQNGCESSGLS